MVATLPRRLAEGEAAPEGLAILELPRAPIQATIEAAWPEQAEGDVALRWLVNEVEEAGKALAQAGTR